MDWDRFVSASGDGDGGGARCISDSHAPQTINSMTCSGTWLQRWCGLAYGLEIGQQLYQSVKARIVEGGCWS